MLFDSAIVTRGSGSIGGLTASHNRGGQYFRARVTPVDISSTPQQTARALLADLTVEFSEILTQVQRDAWALYAANVELPGPLGSPRNVGAIGMFVRSNLARRIAGFAQLDDAPTIFDLGNFTPIDAPTAAATGDLIGFGFDNSDAWAQEDDASMLLFVGRPKNAGVQFFKGPFLFAGSVDGNLATPPTPPASIAAAKPFAAGQKIFFRVQVTRADGRYSTSQTTAAIAT